MQVVAVKPAFFGGVYVHLGEELSIPADTCGTWFAPVGTPMADRALREKAPPRPKGWRTPHTEMRKPEVTVRNYDPYAGM